jgi:hypothetical protein
MYGALDELKDTLISIHKRKGWKFCLDQAWYSLEVYRNLECMGIGSLQGIDTVVESILTRMNETDFRNIFFFIHESDGPMYDIFIHVGLFDDLDSSYIWI